MYENLLFSHLVVLFLTPWTAAHQASLSFTIYQSSLKLMSIESVIHPAISSSVIPFTSCLQSFLASGSNGMFSHSVMSDSLRPRKLQHARLPCLSPNPRACSHSCSLSWWCHPTISSSVVPFSSRFQSFQYQEMGQLSNESALCIRWPKCWINPNCVPILQMLQYLNG